MGHDYERMEYSSQISKQKVRTQFAGLILISFVWGAIGYISSRTYLHASVNVSIVSGLICMFLIHKIEMQVIHGSRSRWASVFRIVMGLVMAFLGSIILDQAFFIDDIKREKQTLIDIRVEERLPGLIKEYNDEIALIDSVLIDKENERSRLIEDVRRTPTVPSVERGYDETPMTKSIKSRDSLNKPITKDTIVIVKTENYSVVNVDNPNMALIPEINETISKLSQDRKKYTESKFEAKETLREEEESLSGLLDEITILQSVISRSTGSKLFYFAFFAFFFGLELFVMIASSLGNETDYEVGVRTHNTNNISRLAK